MRKWKTKSRKAVNSLQVKKEKTLRVHLLVESFARSALFLIVHKISGSYS